QPYNLPTGDSSKTIYQQIQKDISSIKVDTIVLQNVDFIYINKSRQAKETRLFNIKLFFSDILIDSSTQFDQQRFLFAKNCLVSLKDYSINTSDSLYRFKIEGIEIATTARAMQLKTLTFQPRVSVKQFYEHLKHQQDRFEVSLKEASFTNINWWSILAEESF